MEAETLSELCLPKLIISEAGVEAGRLFEVAFPSARYCIPQATTESRHVEICFSDARRANKMSMNVHKMMHDDEAGQVRGADCLVGSGRVGYKYTMEFVYGPKTKF
jgi:hypothetical protein